MSDTEEKVRSQARTERLLADLTNPKQTKMPKSIRERARQCLRHLATPTEVRRGAM